MIHFNIFLQITHRSPKWPLFLRVFKQTFSEFLTPTSCYERNLNSRVPTGFSRMILLHGIRVSQSDIISHLLTMHWQTTFAHHNEK